MISPKRPWPRGALSPWASDPNPPTVFEAARMYPGRAVRNAIIALFPALPLGTLIAASIGWLIRTIVGFDVEYGLHIASFLVISALVWGWITHGELRGRVSGDP